MNPESIQVPTCPFPFTKWNGHPLDRCVVYVMTKDGVIIYVGSSSHLIQRQYDYRWRRIRSTADAVYHLITNTRGEALDCEYWLIDHLKPEFNKQKPFWKQRSPFPPFFSCGIKEEAAA